MLTRRRWRSALATLPLTVAAGTARAIDLNCSQGPCPVVDDALLINVFEDNRFLPHLKRGLRVDTPQSAPASFSW